MNVRIILKLISISAFGAFGYIFASELVLEDSKALKVDKPPYVLQYGKDYYLKAEFEIIGLKNNESCGISLALWDESSVDKFTHDSISRAFPVSQDVLDKNGVFTVEKLIHSDAPLMATVVADAYIPKGASLKLVSLSVVSDEKTLNALNGSSSSGGRMRALVDGMVNISGDDANASSSSATSNEDFKKFLELFKSGDGNLEKVTFSKRIIFVDSVNGDDGNSGADRSSAKRTSSAAMLEANDGDEIVLRGSDVPYDAIQPKSGANVTIKPEGNVIIKGR